METILIRNNNYQNNIDFHGGIKSHSTYDCFNIIFCLFEIRHRTQYLYMRPKKLRAILCKYGASYIGTISRSDSDFDETC